MRQRAADPYPPRVRIAVSVLAAGLLLSGCTGSSPTPVPLPRVTAPVPGVTLPPGALSLYVPSPEEVPAGLVPLLMATGPRDAHAIAAFSADAGKAGKTLKAHHFTGAYAAQYADPADGRVLSVVVSQFATPKDAQADYASDTSATGGTALPAAGRVGAASEVRTQALPGQSKGQLVTVRFRVGRLTWLVAYGAAPTADPQVAMALSRLLAGRAPLS